MPLHVKRSNGSDGFPVGYPIECAESESTTLLPGYVALLTPAQLAAEVQTHKTAVDALHITRRAESLTREQKARVARLFDEPGERAMARVVFRQENLVRQLIRALRTTSTAANNAATTAGLPTTANSADQTMVQFLATLEILDT